MCHYVSSDAILAFLLSKNQNALKVNDLRVLRQRIQESIPSIYVDITLPALYEAVEGYSEMFAWNGNSITRAPNADTFYSDEAYLGQIFLSDLSAGEWAEIEKVLKENGGVAA